MQADAKPQADLETLHQLNRDYIDSVQRSDVRRLDEILAADFRCSNPDGTLVDRDGFLKQTARPTTISNLEANDVEIRLMGDFAIIHATHPLHPTRRRARPRPLHRRLVPPERPLARRLGPCHAELNRRDRAETQRRRVFGFGDATDPAG